MKKRIKEVLPNKLVWIIKRRLSWFYHFQNKITANKFNGKIFCVGLNKTGTTSLKVVMEELGYKVGQEMEADKFLKDWGKRKFRKIIDYCNSADFFQDIPFSKPYTFVVLDHEFTDSKFILTVRDNAEQWYNSLIKFHSKSWGKNGCIPTKEDLQNGYHIYKGRPWESNRLTYNTPEDDSYNKEILMQYYINHNDSVKEYFRHRPDDLLVLNVAEEDAYQKLCDFLGVEPLRDTFPWKNKTTEVKV